MLCHVHKHTAALDEPGAQNALEKKSEIAYNLDLIVPADTVVECLAATCKNTSAADIKKKLHEHTDVIDRNGKYYVSDGVVADFKSVKRGGKYYRNGIFTIVVGKVPAPPCIRGALWNCIHGRILKSILFGVPELNSRCDGPQFDALLKKHSAARKKRQIIPFDKIIHFGREPLINSHITKHGVWFTELSFDGALPYQTNPPADAVERGAGAVRDLAATARPHVLTFVYKWCATQMLKVAGCDASIPGTE